MMSLQESVSKVTAERRRLSLVNDRQHTVYYCGKLWNGALQLCPKIIPLPPKIAVWQIACGSLSMILLDKTGTAYAWGRGNYGELGHGDVQVISKPQQISVRNVESGAKQTIVRIACGMNHSMFLTESSDLYACGCAEFGRLGLGRRRNSTVTTPTLIKAFPPVRHEEKTVASSKEALRNKASPDYSASKRGSVDRIGSYRYSYHYKSDNHGTFSRFVWLVTEI